MNSIINNFNYIGNYVINPSFTNSAFEYVNIKVSNFLIRNNLFEIKRYIQTLTSFDIRSFFIQISLLEDYIEIFPSNLNADGYFNLVFIDIRDMNIAYDAWYIPLAMLKDSEYISANLKNKILNYFILS